MGADSNSLNAQYGNVVFLPELLCSRGNLDGRAVLEDKIAQAGKAEKIALFVLRLHNAVGEQNEPVAGFQKQRALLDRPHIRRCPAECFQPVPVRVPFKKGGRWPALAIVVLPSAAMCSARQVANWSFSVRTAAR